MTTTTTASVATETAPVTRFLDEIKQGQGISSGVFAGSAVLDATVPNWRLSARGEAAIRNQLSGWYANPGRFEELERSPIDDGELVTFTLTWSENGVPFAAHQAYVIEVEGDYIASAQMWCGGRWDAALLAQMGAKDADPAQ
jgi:hypothetical protein